MSENYDTWSREALTCRLRDLESFRRQHEAYRTQAEDELKTLRRELQARTAENTRMRERRRTVYAVDVITAHLTKIGTATCDSRTDDLNVTLKALPIGVKLLIRYAKVK